MKLQTFAVYDSKAEAYIQPFFSQTIGTATRSFEQAVNTPDHDFSRYGADYTLFHLGDFDQSTGTWTPLKALVNLGNALIYMKEIK